MTRNALPAESKSKFSGTEKTGGGGNRIFMGNPRAPDYMLSGLGLSHGPPGSGIAGLFSIPAFIPNFPSENGGISHDSNNNGRTITFFSFDFSIHSHLQFFIYPT
jgi:hypothetical protein